MAKIYLSSKGIKPNIDNAPIINKVIAGAKEKSTLVFPDGVFPLDSTLIQEHKCLSWEGSEDTTFNIRHTGVGFKFSGNGARRFHFENFVIKNDNVDSTHGTDHLDAHGIVINCQMNIENVDVLQVKGNGITIYGDLENVPNSNASFCKFEDVLIFYCGGDGIYLKGGDANCCRFDHVDIRDNLGWGYNDDSFLGNLPIGIMTHHNKKGAFKVGTPENSNPRTTLVGCYTENDQPVSWIGGASPIIGGRVNFDLHSWASAFYYKDGKFVHPSD